MKRYKLEITVNSPFFSARDTLYRDTVDAANAIEMRQSEYFTWEDDAQESLSRSNAISLAEKEMQGYLHLKDSLYYEITVKNENNEVCCEGAEIVNDNGYSVCSLCGANLTTQREDYDE